jgi:hypothetical protein
MNRQRGLALSALLLWGVVIALVAILVIRVLPEVIEYYKIRQAVKAVAASPRARRWRDSAGVWQICRSRAHQDLRAG